MIAGLAGEKLLPHILAGQALCFRLPADFFIASRSAASGVGKYQQADGGAGCGPGGPPYFESRLQSAGFEPSRAAPRSNKP